MRKALAQSLAWALASQVSRQAITFLTTILLARFLSPAEFGIVGMATVFTGFVAILNDVGIGGALIQKESVTEEHLASMFWLNLVAGIGLCGITWLIAPALATFFDSPPLTEVLRSLGFLFIAGALGVVQQCVLMRELNFRGLSLVETAATLLSALLAFILAWRGFGYWSLVTQLVLVPTVTTAGLWLTSRWRPRFVFKWRAAKELLSFGMHMAGFNGINYLARNMDYLVVGKFLGPTALGHYSLAFRLMMYPLQSISTAVGRVAFPVLSRRANDLSQVREGYLKLIKGVSLATFPMVVGIFSIAPDFVLLAYGPEWAATGRILQILCLAGLVQSVGTTVGVVYQSLGRPDIQLRMALANATLTVLSLWVGVRWGIYGVATAYSAFAFAWVHFSLFVATRVLDLSYFNMYARLMPALIAAVSMGVGLTYLRTLVARMSPLWLLSLVGAGAIIYGVLLCALRQLRVQNGRPSIQL